MASQGLDQALDMIRELWSTRLPEEEQAKLSEMRRRLGLARFPLMNGVAVTAVSAAGVPAEWIIAGPASPDRRLTYFHGGGYCTGGLDSHRDLASRISLSSGFSVLLADYRLAPEHPFPAAVEDALAAFRWMRENGPTGPGSATDLAVAGDSAGGGLTLALLMKLRERGDPMPDVAATLSAWTDLAHTGESATTRADVDALGKIVGQAGIIDMAQAYLAGADPKTPLASPLYGDLAGLPPLLMQVGDYEGLLDDTRRVADKAREAGVDVTLEVYPEMFHVWHQYAKLLPEAQQAIDRIGEFVKSHTKTAAR